MDLMGFPVPQSPAVQQRVRTVRLPLDVHSVAGRFRPEVDLLAEVPHFCKAEIVEHVTAPHGVGLKRPMAPLRKRHRSAIAVFQLHLLNSVAKILRCPAIPNPEVLVILVQAVKGAAIPARNTVRPGKGPSKADTGKAEKQPECRKLPSPLVF